MDPVINSLTQSPFVRSLSKVPSKASNFTYGLRDNVPPFSMQKVVVKPYNNPSKTTQKATHKFKIPQHGTLNRAYLRIRMKNQELRIVNISEAVYTDIFDVSSVDQATHDEYVDFAADVRVPWVHECQMRYKNFKNNPLGGGGGWFMHTGTLRDPTSSNDNATLSIASPPSIAARGMMIEPFDMMGKSSNAWNVINIMGDITLSAGTKILETIPSETIPSEVVKMPEQLRDFYIRGMTGFAAGDDAGEQLSDPTYTDPWDPSGCLRDAYGRIATTSTTTDLNPHGSDLIARGQNYSRRQQHADFMVPLPLSSLKMLKKNYQTRFMEEIELSIDMKPIERGFNKITNAIYASTFDEGKHELELVLIYHNWHGSVEEQLRRTNFKPNIPAQIYGTNWFTESGPFKAVSDTESIKIPLTCRNLATEIVIVGRSLSTGLFSTDVIKKSKSDYTMSLDSEVQFNVELLGGSKSLWSGSNLELHGVDSSDYHLNGRMRGGDCGYGGGMRSKRGGIMSDVRGVAHARTSGRTSGMMPSQGGVDFSFGDNMCILKFGMDSSEEFYSGGLALQTISKPSLVITPVQGRGGSKWVEREVEFNVYVKYANMVEVDSETGSVRTTLNV